MIAQVTRVYRGLSLRPGLVGAEDRRDYLKFLIHLVADLHQPLNCADNGDEGGRKVPITLMMAASKAPVRDLHAAWESALLGQRGLTEGAYTELLLKQVDNRVPDEPLNIALWAWQSHELAVKHAYRYPGFTPGLPPTDAVKLDSNYVKEAASVIDRQLALAGVRLGRMLDALFR